MRHQIKCCFRPKFGQTTPTVLKYPIYYSSFVLKNKEEIVNFFNFYNIF